MSKKDQFENLKSNLLKVNDALFGDEIKTKWGENVYILSQSRVAKMTEADFDKTNQLAKEIIDNLLIGFQKKDPASLEAVKACALHKEWLLYFWADAMYSREAHLNLTENYVQDERFRYYYDQHQDGLSQFFNEAMTYYLINLNNIQ